MRVAWFAPMAAEDEELDARDFSIDAIPLVGSQHDVEVFASTEAQARVWRGWTTPVRDPFDFVWRNDQRPFDLIVYHLSNQPQHQYVWGYLWNYPGLLVLHELHLHHSRARVLLDRLEPRLRDYGEELNVSHGVDPVVGQPLALFTGDALRAWPMRRAAVAAARSVAVHHDVLAEELTVERTDSSVDVIRPGVADSGVHHELRASPEAADIRARLGIPADGVVLGLFGAAGRAGRVPQLMQALASLRTTHPNLYLMIAGRPTGDCDLALEARRRGLLDRVTFLEPVTQRTLGSFLGACDIALSLAWPPDANTPPNWLRPLACGLPTIVTGRHEHATLPLLDPATWTIGHSDGSSSDEAIGVSVDLSSERQSLQLAIARLATDPGLRRTIGDAGRVWWSQRHTLRQMADDYLTAIERASRRSPPAVALPRHLRPDVFEHARRLAEGAGASVPPELASIRRGNRPE